jgi:hypothetical protein
MERETWSPETGAYLAQAHIDGEWRPLTTVSIDSLYPLLLPDLSVDRVEAIYTLIDTRFGAPRAVPVSVQTGPVCRSGLKPRLWGPNQVWANTNMFVRDGLRHHATRVQPPLRERMLGYADRIDADWRLLKRAGRYSEYYEQDGTGGGEGPFFWDCLRPTTFSVTFRGSATSLA